MSADKNKKVTEDIVIPPEYEPKFPELHSKEEPVESKPQTFVVKTEIDAYINEVMQTQPKTLDDIQVVSSEFEPAENRLALPKDLQDVFTKRGLAPRWINKDKKMIDRAIHIRGWLIVNRVYFPEIKKYHFTANGTIENGDSILGFMPAERAEKLRKRPGEISNERLQNLPMDKYKDSKGEKIGYYKPDLSPERDGEQLQTAGISIQPDQPSNE